MSLLSLSPSMEYLPENVMVDILSRLPVKTIIRCKTVCKKWLDLLLTGYPKPGILKWVEVEDELDHHNLHHDPALSLDLNLAPIFQNSQICTVGSVTGLICLRQDGPKHDNTYICNPITREYMLLPTPRYYRQVHGTIVYGFGVGSLTHEYKVIRIFRADRPTSTSEVEVYTVGTGQWRSLGHVLYWLNGNCGSYLNGHAHWNVGYCSFSEEICAFDFDKETFELFPSPPFEEENRIYFQSLGVLNGCLCRCDIDDCKIMIWVMKEYGIKNSWHKEVNIKHVNSPELDWSIRIPVYLIEGLKDGTILMVSHAYKLMAYCPWRKTVVDTKLFDSYLNGLVYRPSFHRLQNFENERVHVF